MVSALVSSTCSTTIMNKRQIANINNFQSMTCDLFWVSAPATPQPKIPPHSQPHATCYFDGCNLRLASATAISINSYSTSY